MSFDEAISHLSICEEENYYCPLEMHYDPEYRTVCKGKEMNAHFTECPETIQKCEKCSVSYKLSSIWYKCDNDHFMTLKVSGEKKLKQNELFSGKYFGGF